MAGETHCEQRRQREGSLGYAQQTPTCIYQGQVHHLLPGAFCSILQASHSTLETIPPKAMPACTSKVGIHAAGISSKTYVPIPRRSPVTMSQAKMQYVTLWDMQENAVREHWGLAHSDCILTATPPTALEDTQVVGITR